MKILVVDDRSENLCLLESLFQGEGYEVATAANGKEALDRLQDGASDIIISDILMPVMDGFELCRRCKTDPKLRNIPFIFYTANYTDKKDEQFSLALGADRYIVKPQDPDRLLKIVKETVDLGKGRTTTDSSSVPLDDHAYLSEHRERLIQKLEGKMRDLETANKALSESEQKYRLVVENATESILIAQDGVIKYANQFLLKTLGYSEAFLTSRPFTEFIHPEDREMVFERYLKRITGKEFPAVYSFRVMADDGTVRWMEITAVLIEWQGRPATLNFLTDITERKRAEDALAESFEKTHQALEGTVQAVARIVEARDPYTAGHQRRASELAWVIATEMGLAEDCIQGLRLASTIHDIGKISVPAEILSKPSKLTETEFGLIQAHSKAGHDILNNIDFPWPIARIILEHHERINGSGYPNGLTGDSILTESKILSVADVVESMASHRPYRPALGIDIALDEIMKNKGILYDPEAVDACLRAFKEKDYRMINAM